MEWPRHGWWWTGLLGDDSCERSNLSTVIGRVGQRVIPPRVAFNRLVAGETLKRQGHDSTNCPPQPLARRPANPAPTLAPNRCQASSASGEANHRGNRPAVLCRDWRHRTSRTLRCECSKPRKPASRFLTAPTCWSSSWMNSPTNWGRWHSGARRPYGGSRSGPVKRMLR